VSVIRSRLAHRLPIRPTAKCKRTAQRVMHRAFQLMGQTPFEHRRPEPLVCRRRDRGHCVLIRAEIRRRDGRHDRAGRSERQGKAGNDSFSSNLGNKRHAENAVLLAREIQPRKRAKAPEPPSLTCHDFGRDDCDLAFFRFGPRFRRTPDRTNRESGRIEVATERRALHTQLRRPIHAALPTEE